MSHCVHSCIHDVKVWHRKAQEITSLRISVDTTDIIYIIHATFIYFVIKKKKIHTNAFTQTALIEKEGIT